MHLTRRNFLNLSGASCIGLAFGGVPGVSGAAQTEEARYYEKQEQKKVKCTLCPRDCVVDNKERGYCGVRENREGTYYTLVYGRPCTIHVDPIEKKPFFHFYPGTTAFSTSTVGCNVNCKFCQNWEISQSRPEHTRYYQLSPEDFVQRCIRFGSPTIAYTYAEPVVFTEYMYDIAVEARKAGIKNVMITNGYIHEKPMRDLAKVLDAVKIDLKSFRERYYKETCEGTLKPVLDTLVLLSSLKVWLEIVYLVVPTLNDGTDEFKELSSWCINALGVEVPIHFSRFYPQYRLKNLPPTPVSTLERARTIYQEAGGKFVYIGNVPGHKAENTYCPSCGELLIQRRLYDVDAKALKKGKCKSCSEKIPGIWEDNGKV